MSKKKWRLSNHMRMKFFKYKYFKRQMKLQIFYNLFHFLQCTKKKILESQKFFTSSFWWICTFWDVLSTISLFLPQISQRRVIVTVLHDGKNDVTFWLQIVGDWQASFGASEQPHFCRGIICLMHDLTRLIRRFLKVFHYNF